MVEVSCSAAVARGGRDQGFGGHEVAIDEDLLEVVLNEATAWEPRRNFLDLLPKIPKTMAFIPKQRVYRPFFWILFGGPGWG